MSAIGGAKNPKREWFNPFETAIKQKELKKVIDQEVAKICCELFDNKKMPPWVIEQIDIETMKMVLD